MNLEDLKNKKVEVLAMDFQQQKPRILEKAHAKIQGWFYKWSERNNAWALCRPTIGIVKEDEIAESTMQGFRGRALWFHPLPGQSVQYKIRITQGSLNEFPDLVKYVDQVKLLNRFQLLKMEN